MKQDTFKTCTSCNHVWPTLEDFLSDPELKMNGYQVHFDNLLGGLFIFTHCHKGCYTSIAVPVKEFTSLSRRPILTQRTVQPAGCSNLCEREGALEACPVECECSWVREVIQAIKNFQLRN